MHIVNLGTYIETEVQANKMVLKDFDFNSSNEGFVSFQKILVINTINRKILIFFLKTL